ncbi:MAG: MMPL family transporter [Pseudomonadota bacterium]
MQARASQLIRAITRASARHALATLLVGIVLLLASSVYLATHMAVETGTDEMIDPDLPFRQLQAEVDRAFPELADTFVVVVDGPIPEAAEVAAGLFVERLAATGAAFDDVFAPALLPFFREHALLYRSVEEVDRTLARLAEAQPLLRSLAGEPGLPRLLELLGEALEAAGGAPLEPGLVRLLDALEVRLRAVAAGTAVPPLSWRALTGETGATDQPRVVLTLRPVLDFARLQPAKEALQAARLAAAEVEAALPETHVALTGKIALNAEELRSVSQGALWAGAASLVLVSLVLGVTLRSLRLVLATLVTLVTGLAVTGAFGLALFGSFNIVSVSFAVLFIGLGIAFAIHVALRYQEERGWGLAPVAAAGQTGATAGVALALCAPTTAIAFLAFTPTAYVGLAQLGVIAAFGMFVSLALALTLLPALLVLWRVPLRRLAGAGFRLPARVRQGAVVLALLLAALAATQLGGIRFDANPLNLKDSTSPSVVAFRDLATAPGANPYRINVLADDAAAARAMAERLAALPEVDAVLWLERFVPANQDAKLALIEDALFFLEVPAVRPSAESEPEAIRAALAGLIEGPRADEVPGLREAARAALAADAVRLSELETELFRYWPHLLTDLDRLLAVGPVGVDDLPPALVDRYRAADGRLRLEVTPAAPIDGPEALRAFVEAVRAVAPNAAGSPVQIVGAAEVVRDAMVQATLYALLGITLFLWLTLRSVRDTALVLAPVLLAALMTVGAGVALGLPFNFANVIVLPLLIGFGVDSAIHVVLRARQDGARWDFGGGSTPRAVLASALTTIASFGTLAISAHRGTASMGQLLTLSVLATLAATLLVLPEALRRLGRR